MNNIGAILGWKFANAAGICTRDGEITAWPDALGPMPTAEQITEWTAEHEAISASQARAAKLNTDTESQLEAIRSKYPLSEILTWPKQEAEARALLADARAAAPLLTAMAQIRGIPVQDLAARVVVKADAYTAAVAQAIGTRQKLEDAIETEAGAVKG